ncbi:hypothetical protein PHMEG_0004343 [Phytophthora megakarya]|uniref:Uncharacterized protein n=1 Tax=Phytophthora megakarya TaxID=4795 RepID=A0A225WU77_9STRA|nr:hypothetical protein PHMEG_0004343 [Phytophthora megakarya]
MTLLSSQIEHHITPPPALDDTKQELFFLEYDYPELIVRQVALTLAPRLEREYAQNQVCEWLKNHKNTGGMFVWDRTGYEFNLSLDPRTPGYLQQLIPDLSYVDEQTWSKLHVSTDEKDMMYIPCVPAVVVQIMTDVDKMEELQTKVSRFIDTGTRERVIVDTSGNRIWIHNQGEEPGFV